MAGFEVYSKWLRDHLGRVTSSGRYIAELDGLRFVAIVSVVLFHIRYRICEGLVRSYCDSNWVSRAIENGHFGVELFFVISGFILALPFASYYLAHGPSVPLANYYLRRLTRLEPPYVLCLVLLFTARVVWLGMSPQSSLGHLLVGFVYLHNVFYNAANPINAVAWSLEIEVQFYLLVPLLAKLFSIRRTLHRRMAMMVLALLFISVQLKFINGSPSWLLSRSILNYAQYFLAGFLLADLYLISWKRTAERSYKWDCLGALSWFAMMLLWFTSLEGLATAVFPLALVGFCTSAFRGVVTNRLLRISWVTVVGGMCYSIYLLHVPVQGLLSSALGRVLAFQPPELRLFAQVVLLSVGTLVMSAGYFAFVERPFMFPDWPRRVAQGVRGLLRRSSSAASPT